MRELRYWLHYQFYGTKGGKRSHWKNWKCE